ncbi:uncharacterized protein PSFLO_04536 [Pseudozyma flocculosa]|uniref:Uncharacterized protein n=1 Tax=Pseudozyma flocculosa TaxID=84751 RepID=A0A5C3F5W6_9BASI|nr:uncharacterized protein PSFLO_04536 [Pseudozyma flocculosa]
MPAHDKSAVRYRKTSSGYSAAWRQADRHQHVLSLEARARLEVASRPAKQGTTSLLPLRKYRWTLASGEDTNRLESECPRAGEEQLDRPRHNQACLSQPLHPQLSSTTSTVEAWPGGPPPPPPPLLLAGRLTDDIRDAGLLASPCTFLRPACLIPSLPAFLPRCPLMQGQRG